MEKEIWKSIKGYSNYIFSNMGNVMVLPKYSDTVAGKLNSKTNGRYGHLLKPRATNYGHLQVALLNDNGETKMEYVHRLIATAFLKSKPGMDIVCHKDGNPSNNKLNNLMWGNQHINLSMVTNWNNAKRRGSLEENWKIVNQAYNANKKTYNGNSKELVKNIASALELSPYYVQSLLYLKKYQKQFINA